MSILQSWPVQREFDTKNMPFRRLGPSGLRVPVFSLGGWFTVEGVVAFKEIIKIAFDAGINMFDTAESYTKGKSEEEMGRAIKELGLRRTDLVISTKLFWGFRKGPNDTGLSRKHVIEGTQESLARLGLDYAGDAVNSVQHFVAVATKSILQPVF